MTNTKSNHPNYLKVFLTFARNSLVRDMMFRTNFILEAVTSLAWSVMNIGFYWIIFEHTTSIGAGTGWGKYEFFVFMGTTWIINSIVPNVFYAQLRNLQRIDSDWWSRLCNVETN